MKKKMSEVADIRAGYTQRSQENVTETREYFMINIRNVSDDGLIDYLGVTSVKLPPVDERFFIKEGNVLLSARGTRQIAAVCEIDAPRLLVGTQFFVIAPDTRIVLPGYLAWYINSTEAQSYITSRVMGSRVVMLKIGDLIDLEVPVPPLAIQDKIIEIARLFREERGLTNRISDLKVQLLAGQISQLVNTASLAEQGNE